MSTTIPFKTNNLVQRQNSNLISTPDFSTNNNFNLSSGQTDDSVLAITKNSDLAITNNSALKDSVSKNVPSPRVTINSTTIKNSIQSKILATPPKIMTTPEIEQFLQQIHAPPRDIYLIKGLINKVMQPNQVLVQAINTAYNVNDLISIGIALRYGANPNLYVNSKDIGKIHILAYTYYKLSQPDRNKEMLDNVISLLLLAGSALANPVYSIDSNINNDNKNYSTIESVNTWLETQNYTIPDIGNNDQPDTKYSLFNSDNNNNDDIKRSRLGTILNNIDLIPQEYFDPVTAIISHANNVLIHFKDQLKGKNNLTRDDNIPFSYYYFKDSVDFLNYTSFKFLLQNGYKPGYVMLNYIISIMLQYKQENDSISYTQLYYMVMEAIDHGIVIDEQQFDMLNKVDPKGADKLKQSYAKPVWQKYCQTNTGHEQYLSKLAYNLGLDYKQPQDKICQDLRKVAQINPQDYIAAFIKRQQNRIANNVSNSEQYIKNSDQVLQDNLCTNRSVGQYPYLYNDLDIAYYKDSADNVWCFTSNDFEEIRKTKRNPITQEMLPDSILQQIQNQRNTLKRLGLLNGSDNVGKTVTDALTELNTKDAFATNEINQRLTALQQLAKLYCDNNVCNYNVLQLQLLNPVQISNLLNMWGIPVINIGLNKIDSELQIATFIFIVYTILRNNPNRIQQIFTDIQNMLINTK